MSVRQLVIDGVTVPVWASTKLDQSYERVQAVTRRRTADGSLVQRSLWTGKLKTVLSGGGLAPSGLQAIDTSAAFDLWCIKPIAINSASNVIDIPAARRSDSGSEPFGFAVVGNAMVATPVAMSVDQATLTTVAGATAYQVRYFPVLSVMADPVQEDLSRGFGFGWKLEAEEV